MGFPFIAPSIKFPSRGSSNGSLMSLLHGTSLRFREAKFLVFGPLEDLLESGSVTTQRGLNSDDEASSCFSDGLDSRP